MFLQTSPHYQSPHQLYTAHRNAEYAYAADARPTSERIVKNIKIANKLNKTAKNNSIAQFYYVIFVLLCLPSLDDYLSASELSSDCYLKRASMSDINYYAAPKAKVFATDRATNCYRDGKFVIVPTGSELPERCIICNEPLSSAPKSRKLYWHSPWIYLLILMNILIYAIVALIVRKKCALSPGLCSEHATRRLRRLMVVIGVGVAGLVIGFYALSHDYGQLSLISFAIAIISLIAAIFVGRLIYANKITADFARIGGCQEPYLAALDEANSTHLTM